MDFFTILAIALGLSFDTFAVSLSYGVILSSIRFRQAIRVATVLAVFQGGLTVAGYFLGSVISSVLKATDHWIALALLSFLGIKMIVEGLKKTNKNETKDSSNTQYRTRVLGREFCYKYSFFFNSVDLYILYFDIS